MTHQQQFEERLADWLQDGPLDAPDGAVTSAVAFARAHPRRRNLIGGLWRITMNRLQPVSLPASAHRARVTAFASIAVIAVVGLAVVGGGALVLNQGPANVPAAGVGATVTPAPTPPATPLPTARTDAALVADLAAVWSNPYDAATVAALYAPNAVVHEIPAGQTHTGLDEIGTRIRALNGSKFTTVVTSAAIRQDRFVAAFAKYGTPGDQSGRGLVVYELTDGKVLNQWVYPAP